MKKIIIFSAVCALMLCGCHHADILLPDNVTPADTSSVSLSAETASDTPSETAPAEETAPYEQPDGSAPYTDFVNIHDYVEIMYSETPAGKIEYPFFSEETLDPDDARAANELFDNIRQELIDDASMTSADGSDAENILNMTAYSADNGILSVIMQYSFRYGSPEMHNAAVNFDLASGKSLTPHDVINKLGYTEEEVENSVNWYFAANLKLGAQFNMIYDCYERGVLPDGSEPDGEAERQKLCDNAAEKFRASEKTVYCENGYPFVSASVPSGPYSEYFDVMVAVGHDTQEIRSRNRYNFFGLMSDRDPLSPQGAADKIRDLFGYEDDTRFLVEEIDFIPYYDDPYDVCPAYLVYAYTGDGDNAAVVGRYAAGVLEEMTWEYSVESDAYELLMNGSPFIDWSVGFRENALGMVVRNPDEYCKWSLEPVLTYDASNGDPYAETILICSLYDTTDITLLEGTVSQEDMEFTGEKAASFRLGAGDYALIKCSVPEVVPVFAVEFSTESDKGTYVVYYDGRGEANTLEFAFSDYAVG